MTDSEYMQFALKEAQKAAEEGEIPIGAVLVYRDMVIAAAKKRTGTPQPMQKSSFSGRGPAFWADGV